MTRLPGSPFQGYYSAVTHTPEGGLAIQLINKTGAASVKGSVLSEGQNIDLSCELAPASTLGPIGIMYDDGIPDGEPVWVVIQGLADVLLKNNTAAVRGNWVVTSNVTGRADATATDPPGGTLQDHSLHFAEIGHCLQSKSAGTNVLSRCLVHFN